MSLSCKGAIALVSLNFKSVFALVCCAMLLVVELGAAPSFVERNKGFNQTSFMDSKSSISIDAYSVFSHQPPKFGVLPLHLKLRTPVPENTGLSLQSTSNKDYDNSGVLIKTWPLEFKSSESTMDILAPSNNIENYSSLHIVALGAGAQEGGLYMPGATVPMAITNNYSLLRGKNLKSALETSLVGTHFSRYGSSVEIAEFAPEDMIQDSDQLLGWTYLIITEQELDALGEPQSEHRAFAFEQFLKRGGQLWVIDQEDIDGRMPAQWHSLQLPTLVSRDKNLRRYGVGLGQVIFQLNDSIEWSDMERFMLSDRLYALDVRPVDLKNKVPSISSSVLGFLFMVLVFALLVGPVNLWIFCRGNRLRLVLTTPLISLVSALGFIALIIVIEGLGGKGARSQVRYVDPYRHQHLVQQQQLSRTGVVMNGNFELPDQTHIWPIALDPTNFKSSREATSISLMPHRGGQGWFSSRNLQAQLLKSTESSRERVDVQWKAEGPVILSSLGQSCEKFWLVSKDGVWEAEKVIPGDPVILKTGAQSRLPAWSKSFIAQLKTHAQAGENWFMATSTENSHFIPTLLSIDWTEHETLWVGPLLSKEAN